MKVAVYLHKQRWTPEDAVPSLYSHHISLELSMLTYFVIFSSCLYFILLQECVKCNKKGASMGCLSKGCKMTYHFMCAQQAG